MQPLAIIAFGLSVGFGLIVGAIFGLTAGLSAGIAFGIAFIMGFLTGINQLEIRRTIKNRKARYHCNKCGKSFASGSALGGHMGSHKVRRK